MSDLHCPAAVPSVLIWGGWYGSRNIGDTAILLGLKQLIQRVNESQEVYVQVMSTDPDYTSTHGVTGKKALVKSELFQPWAWLRVLGAFARPDLVVVSGGTPFFDSSHAIRTLYLLLPIVFRVPFVIFGAGVKPLRSWYGRRSIPWLLRRAESVSVRDEDSQRILADLGVQRVALTADSAFFAKPADPDLLAPLLEAYGVLEEDSLLVVAPRVLSTDRKRLYLQEQMTEALIRDTPLCLASAINRLAGKFDRILVMAMHFHGPDSDVPLIQAIMSQVSARNVQLVDRELRPEMAIALFRRARLVLGVRLHALLLASSMGTPIVGIAYEQKVRSLFERLELQGCCLDLLTLDEDRLVAAAEMVLRDERRIRDDLDRRVSELRALILAQAADSLRMRPYATDGQRDQ